MIIRLIKIVRNLYYKFKGLFLYLLLYFILKGIDCFFLRLFQRVTCQRFPEYLLKPKPWGWPWIMSRNGAFALGLILLISLVILTVQNNNRHKKKLSPLQIDNVGRVLKGNLTSRFSGGFPTNHLKIQEKLSSQCFSECSLNTNNGENFELKITCKNIQNNPGQVAAECINSLVSYLMMKT